MTHAPPREFLLREAVAALANAGQLYGVLVPCTAGLQLLAPDACATLPGAFHGARLDSRLLQSGELFVALPGANVHGRRFAPGWLEQGGWVLTDVLPGADPLGDVTAPGGGVLLCADPQAALTTLARHWRQALPVQVAGITGTNGKTTTKDFLAALLSGAGPTHATAGNFNNFLGLPVTLLGLAADHSYAAIEMGASAVGEIDHLASLAAPRVGVITNAAPAHLAEFGSLAGIITGKGELLDHLPADGVAVLNADSPGFAEWQARARCAVISHGQDAGDHRWWWEACPDGPLLHLDGSAWPVPLPGAHNAANLAAALLAARALGIDEAALRRGLDNFGASPHRGSVLSLGGRVVLDDAYNANPESMVAAAEALRALRGAGSGGRLFAILGHMAELGTDALEIHRQAGRDLAATGLDILVAVGPEAKPLSEGFDAVGGGGHYCPALAEAARWLIERSQPGDHILIKGSRSAAMENIIPLLEDAFAADQRLQD